MNNNHEKTYHERSRWLKSMGYEDLFNQLDCNNVNVQYNNIRQNVSVSITKTYDNTPLIDNETTKKVPETLNHKSLSDLKVMVEHCTECPLHKTRQHSVFARGHSHASWMFIGEAPGASEDAIGQPFVGKAGKLLDAMIVSFGIDIERDVYICNVIKCRPPGNRNPEPEEILACEKYLRRQVECIQPKIIVALGRFAAQTLLGSSENISKLRGKVHHISGIPLIATFHPAYLLRNQNDKRLALDDWLLARKTFLMTQ
jgi:uracil-DNA glycosylase family 4